MDSMETLAQPQAPAWPRAVLFDLLTALLDSRTVWNAAAGSVAQGRAWRAAYLRRTYGCGAYVGYEQLVREAAAEVGLPAAQPLALEAAWDTLTPWDGARELLQALRPHCRLAVVTNCSERLGQRAATRLGIDWDTVVTSETAGFYKPDPRPYRLALQRLGVAAHQRPSSPAPATTCSAPPPSACAPSGTTASAWPCRRRAPAPAAQAPRWRRRWPCCAAGRTDRPAT